MPTDEDRNSGDDSETRESRRIKDLLETHRLHSQGRLYGHYMSTSAFSRHDYKVDMDRQRSTQEGIDASFARRARIFALDKAEKAKYWETLLARVEPYRHLVYAVLTVLIMFRIFK